MYNLSKYLFLKLCKFLGFFKLARRLTKKELRIICYHNFSEFKNEDVVQWKPKLFISLQTFQKRLNYLENQGYKIIPLSEARFRILKNQLSPSSVVITIDDGWYGIKNYAHRILKKKKYSYTVYVVSYHSMKESMVFNLAVSYLFWKIDKKRVNLESLKVPGVGVVELSDQRIRDENISRIIQFGQSILNDHQRSQLLVILCECIGFNYDLLMDKCNFHLMKKCEIKDLIADGVDIQLHTHRHRWPVDRDAAIKELKDNIAYLTPLVKRKLEHFCYPSGFWRPEQFVYLEALGIKTATTCESGLNNQTTHPLKLKRFLDGENIPQIVFEAEMSGFLEILRRVISFMKGLC